MTEPPIGQSRPARINRRAFLRGAGGAGAAAVAAQGLPLPGIAPASAQARAAAPQVFGRIFPQLPPFAAPSPALRDALLDIGKPGGILDARDDLAQGPVKLITDPALSRNNADNPAHTAGTTFVGQFIDHDLTFDTASRLNVPTRPEDAPNARTPAFDLDSVYGRGPAVDAHLYDPADRAKFRVESGGRFEDVPRATDQSAIIGDPRNDQHLIIAGLHAAFLLFHNRAVDLIRAGQLGGAREDADDAAFARGGGSADHDPVFRRARRLTTWHYQWIVLHEFLPLFVGQAMVDRILRGGSGPRFYRPKLHGFMPVEFQGAAYRFGHSMARPSYRANLKGNADGSAFFGVIFDPAQNGRADPDDLRGGRRAPRRFIGWQTFFTFDDPAAAAQVKTNKKIDTHLSSPLFFLTPGTIVTVEQAPIALAQRDLLRQVTWGLPSGQAIARAMRAPQLARDDLGELAPYNLGLDASTPLWYYILKEAEVMADGERLGPVGGRIVAEVFIALLLADGASYLSAAPRWTPTLPSAVPGGFRMVDFLTFAGVDPRSRGQ